ncbi:ribosomal large subunit pseudouridine synthase B [Agrobacterium albertimagni AOL15]|uniref:Pseudouridine synthase n=1 Tax=Agrobacterium albertimagni AOL15 TaxID=1156935 RepID=K2QVE9_9HYPH|nr:pseudouridine synthase [Agrobacterium albertimagni]EKF59187.1 ribosomal large subunit pseudouridine synthase B [Agrobacterium albertimagni AOL15]
MTFKDKSKRPGAKSSDRSGKPQTRKPSAKPSVAAADKPARAPRAAAPAGDETVKPERISKLLARAGVASRRDIERMIMEGRVSVNGKVLETPVHNATLADTIEVDGQPIRGIERTRLWLYHKPAGLVTTNADPEGRATVFENLPEELPRVMSIGRLDINTEGLLLLTNDGGLARVLELPTTGWLRRYRVRAYGEVDQPALDALKEGIAVDGVLYGAIDATLDRKQGHNVWITMGLREGKNREIKNVLGALGLEVNRLIRISYGPFQLGDLPEGKVLEVRGRMLRDQLGPRLIEESKANFDAPIYAHGAEVDDEDAPAVSGKKPAREAKPEWGRDERPSEKKRAPKDWSDKGDRREKVLGRLDTRRDEGAKSGDKFSDKPKRPAGNTKGRTANVWMAPGARPLGEKAAAAAARRKPDPRGPKPTERFDDRPTSTVQITRARDEEGDWIRADGPDQKPGGRGGDRGDRGGKPGGFGARPPRRDGDDRAPRREGSDRGPRREGAERGPKRDFGDRAERAPRRDGDERGPRREFSDRGPKRDFGDRPPRGDRPRDDRPRDDRPRDDRPRGERPFGDKPRGAKPFGDRPAGKSFGGKPSGKPAGKSFGGKPGGGKSFGGKPGGRAPGGPRSGGPGAKPSGSRGGAPKGKR